MTENNLWSFALTIYQRDAVAPACLDLQEQCQIDVPLMLCAVFACLQGKDISDEDLTQLHNLASPWQNDIVQSLRRIRTHSEITRSVHHSLKVWTRAHSMTYTRKLQRHPGVAMA